MSFSRCSPLSSPWRRLDHGSDDEEDEWRETEGKQSLNLQRWMRATLVLNAVERFKCNLESSSPSESSLSSPCRRLRLGANVIRAIFRFKEAGKIGLGEHGPEPEPKDLVRLVAEQDLILLDNIGGINGLARALATDTNKGIEDDIFDIQRRRVLYGSNTYPRHPKKTFLVFLWEACQDVTLIILAICAVVSLILALATKANWYDGASIACTVILVVFVTACSNYRQALQFRSLNEEKQNIHVEVLRGGRRRSISIFDLVVGDIVPLKTGDQIPADGLLTSGFSVTVDESSLTGESDAVHKSTEHPYLKAGCKIVDGYGSMLVTGVGMNTEWGQSMAALSDDIGEETPLQVRLAGAAKVIGVIGLVVAFICFTMLFIRYFVQDYKKNKRAVTVFKRNVNILSVAVTILVVAVPEGLPLAVTLSLAYSMRKMMAEKSLVRHLVACETMGSVTTICSDKTGTLTLNQMTVVEYWVAGQKRDLQSVQALSNSVINVIFDGIAHNTSGSVSILEGDVEPEVSGSPTEKALLWWGLQLGINYPAIKRASSIIAVEPFNSSKKKAGVAIKRGDGSVCALWKGAAEMVLSLCESWLDGDGVERELSDEMVSGIEQTINQMAASSLRCIAFGYKAFDSTLLPSRNDAWPIPETGLTIVAVVGIKDPCRPGVREAVWTCQAAGVKVRMVTGDNASTAKAIAIECGILSPDGIVLEGRDFRNLTEQERAEIIPKIDVLARSTPLDKLLLVKSLKDMNEVVAVTGDGTNDAPALREAHIGLSMGISGTEVAKESSDIVILDDNFASIVNVVRWGRCVYENIQKFIQFQLTVNLAALLTNLVAAARSEDVPLNTVQLLWVNLIMDSFGALALATEPPTDALMDRAPTGLSEPLVTNVMWRNILGQAVYQVVVLLALYFKGDKLLGLKGTDAQRGILRDTIIFNSFVLCQVFNEINARKLQQLNVLAGMLRSHLFCAVIGLTSIVQVVIIEFLGKFFKTKRLSGEYWLLCIGIGFLSIPLGCVMKLVHVPEKPILNANWRPRNYRSQDSEEAVISSNSSTGCWSCRLWSRKEQGIEFEHIV